MGITSKLTGNPSEVIGGLTRCCTMLEMADAYATLADGGVHHRPTILAKVVFSDGSSVNLGNRPGSRVFTDGEAYAGTRVLETVIQAGTGVGANTGCPAAGKTGTAENLDNAWFAGYTPKLATAVWVGFPQGNVPMGPNAFGGTLAAPIWRSYTIASSGGYCGDFPQPTTPWSGTAFFGPHSASGPASNTGTTGPTGPTGTSGSGGTSPKNSYNNPNLFAQPPSGSGGAAPTGGGGLGGGAPGNSGNAPGHGGGGGGGNNH
jgi:penicillin-binding protein 1A